ncbi:MAG: glycosyltransferase family 2 protein [Burkholderiales bacterium]|nr:glycosyltransferase family 2 protein [Burkholderiales bacterium]
MSTRLDMSAGARQYEPEREQERATLLVSIVSYHSDTAALRATLLSLAAAARRLREQLDCTTRLVIIDNSEGGHDTQRIHDCIAELLHAPALPLAITVRGTGRNLGYGAANNLAQREEPDAGYVLILNPDVMLDADALCTGIAALRRQRSLTAVLPRAVDAAGVDLHLCRRLPGFAVLLARAFMPARWQARLPWLRHRLDVYEMRDRPVDQPHDETTCASGCFMLIRGSAWRGVNGFDPAFFLYFEDYDLSMRLRALGPLRYLPEMRIRHDGGGAAAKGWRHIRLFGASALKFFSRHGWRW